jgi:hypothetical protein
MGCYFEHAVDISFHLTDSSIVNHQALSLVTFLAGFRVKDDFVRVDS